MKSGLLILLFAVCVFAQDRSRPEQPIELEGLIEPYDVVDMSAAVDGLIQNVFVDRGDFVESGEPLAELESSVEQLSLDIAVLRATSDADIAARQAQLVLARRTQERFQDLHADSVVSIGELDNARAAYDLAVAELRGAREAQRMAELEMIRAGALLDLRTVRSSISGVVVERYMSPGELVNRTNQVKIVRIAQIDPLLVEVLAPVTLFGSIRAGDEAEVRPEAPIDGVYRARVKVVDPLIDAASGTFGIRLELPNPDMSLPAGLRCRVRFVD